MSDVIVIYGEEIKAYYVDTIGFAELPDFVPDVTRNQELAVAINDLIRDYDLYEYKDAVDDPEDFISDIQQSLMQGDTRDLREELTMIQQDDDRPELQATATQLLEQIPVPMEHEESIRYFVAESMSFPVMGDYTETDSLDEAKRLYDALPEDPSNHDRGIGAILEQKNGKQCDVPMLVEGELKTEHLENGLFAESLPLKEAFSNLEKMVSEKAIDKSKNMIGDMER